MTKRHFNRAGMLPAVDLVWLSGLIPNKRSTVSSLCGLCFLHLVDPVQRTIWTDCSSSWKEVTGIASALYRMYFGLLRQLKYWSWSTYSVQSANVLKHQAMWFCSSPLGIAHYLAKSSRVLIPRHWFLIICLTGTLVWGISSSWCSFAAFALNRRYWITSFWAFIRKIW